MNEEKVMNFFHELETREDFKRISQKATGSGLTKLLVAIKELCETEGWQYLREYLKKSTSAEQLMKVKDEDLIKMKYILEGRRISLEFVERITRFYYDCLQTKGFDKEK